MPAQNQIDDVIDKLRENVKKGERSLVLTLTKKASEDLADYLRELKFRVKYIHSELNTFERAELIRDLRAGKIDVLVGINLLREGMDLPEVTFVAILDADREGYLRSYRSLIQIMGRAARNINSRIVLYADNITDSITQAVDETRRRRERQVTFNRENNITPVSVTKSVKDLLPPELSSAYSEEGHSGSSGTSRKSKSIEKMSISELERLMWEAVDKLDFERAAFLRDAIAEKEREQKGK